jgi:uncharacterized membrane protein
MHNLVHIMAQYAAYFLEIAAILIVFIGSLRILVPYIGHCIFAPNGLREFTAVRLRLGHSLSLGLEFLIGADILKSAVAPTWQNLGLLAGIVAIRSVINFLLTWELKEADTEK